MFMYLMLDRSQANLALARRQLAEVEHSLICSPHASEELDAARIRALARFSGDGKVHGNSGFPDGENDEELPPFMRDDVARMLLGIPSEDGSEEFYLKMFVEGAGANSF